MFPPPVCRRDKGGWTDGEEIRAMRSWVLAAGLLAAAATTGAKAADLDEGPPPDRYGSAYDDPRYADIYKYPRRRNGVPPPGVYGGPYSGPYAAATAALCRADPARARLSRGGRLRSRLRSRPAALFLRRAGRALRRGAARRASWSRSGCIARAGATSTTATCAATSPPFAPGVRTAGCSSSPRPLQRRDRQGRAARGARVPLRSLCLWARHHGAGTGPTEDPTAEC